MEGIDWFIANLFKLIGYLLIDAIIEIENDREPVFGGEDETKSPAVSSDHLEYFYY
jgi:hypothetical protein